MTCVFALQDPILMLLLLAKSSPALEIMTSFLHLSLHAGFSNFHLLLFFESEEKVKSFGIGYGQWGREGVGEQLCNLLNLPL